jgi:glyoxylase-like metal-dependent hydrolase (beta-lactamase superfamily II)
MGGAIAQMARLFPHGGYDFGDHLTPLPTDGDVPGLPNWTFYHTPGHSPGHVSLFRETDGTLLAGDALTTMNMDSWTSQLTREREFHRPPTPFTPDWEVARCSVQTLADLEPSIVAAGHGLPISGPNVAEDLRSYAARFTPPSTGRYVGRPPRADEGIRELPPPVPDPLLMKVAAGATLAVAAGAVGTALARRRGRRR